MKNSARTIITILTTLSAAFLVSSCGGSGADAGATLQVVPNAVTITGPTTTQCATGTAGTFTIFGGNPPYTIKSAFPAYLVVSTNSVSGDGGSFSANVTGVCLNPGVISIEDSIGTVVQVTVANVVHPS